MFYQFQSEFEKKKYLEYLRVTAQLSNLFSTSKTPYVNYRVHESVFCRAFKAKDLSRSDIAFDAQIGTTGFGLKTFLYGNGASFQKIAEFNAKAPELSQLNSAVEIVEKIASWRNERIDFSQKAYGINDTVYHCLVRRDGELLIYEEKMKKISNITNVVDKGNTIIFKADGDEYSFLKSKNTLTKKFYITDSQVYDTINVNIIKSPLDFLIESQEAILLRDQEATVYDVETVDMYDMIYLPLYSINASGKYVPEKSQLNQWNGEGRVRNANEMYIKIPLWIHKIKPDFFPPKDKHFDLELTNGKTVIAKVCQAGGKALMTNPNKDLGEWIRNTLGMQEKQLLTIDMLEIIEIDSVVVYKIAEGRYRLDFAKTNSFEDFKNNLQKKVRLTK